MRLEYKFLLDMNIARSFKERVRPYLIDDDFHSGENLYTVRSIYFDTAKLKYYWEKLDGIRRRKKLRIRGYNEHDDENIIFLEVKRKYENFVRKNRSALKYFNLQQLLDSKDIHSHVMTNNGFSRSLDDAERFLHHLHKRSLIPVILIVYEREAFFSKFDEGLRITFDTDLRYQSFPKLNNLFEDNLTNAMPGKTILEIKFSGGFPIWLQNLIREYGIVRRSVSKYTICIDHEKSRDAFFSKKVFSASHNFNN